MLLLLTSTDRSHHHHCYTQHRGGQTSQVSSQLSWCNRPFPSLACPVLFSDLVPTCYSAPVHSVEDYNSCDNYTQ